MSHGDAMKSMRYIVTIWLENDQRVHQVAVRCYIREDTTKADQRHVDMGWLTGEEAEFLGRILMDKEYRDKVRQMVYESSE